MSVDHTAIQLALRNQALTCSALPALRAWENVQPATTPSGVPYIEEDYVPATTTLLGLVQSGTVETTGLYVLRWYGLANTGLSLSAGIDALLACFAPGTSIALASGQVVRIRGDHAPYRGQVRQAQPGYAVCTITIPWRLFSAVPAAA